LGGRGGLAEGGENRAHGGREKLLNIRLLKKFEFITDITAGGLSLR